MQVDLPDFKLYEILDTLPEQVFDDLTLVAATIFQTPMSFIRFTDKDRHWFKSKLGSEFNESFKMIAFYSHTILQSKTVIIPDTSLDERFANNPMFTDELSIKFYAGTPLITEIGHVIGVLCVMDNLKHEVNDLQIKALEALARQVMSQIESQLNKKKLEENILNEQNLYENQKPKLIENELNKLNNLFHNTPEFIALLEGSEHRFILANPAYQKVTGKSKSDLIGKSYLEALPEFEKQGLIKTLDNVYSTGIPFIGNEILVELDRNNNGILEAGYFNFTYQPVFSHENKIEGISVFGFEITEQVLSRKKIEKLNESLTDSEAKYKTLSESLERKIQERTLDLLQATKEINYERNKLNNLFINAPASICTLEGQEHKFTFINPMYKQLIGTNRYVIGKTVKEALPEVEGQGFYELLDNVYFTGIPFIGNEVLVELDKDDDGTLTQSYLNFIYQPVFDANKQVEGISVFAFDVTKQVVTRKEIEVLYKQVEISNESLQQFAYVASHDLQEPLRTVSSYTKLLGRKYKNLFDDDAKEFMEFIIDGTERMKVLIEGILEYSKIQLKKERETVTDLNEIIENVRYNLQMSIEENHVTITSNNLPSIKAEKVYMLQLFQNLISNAIKYCQKEIAPIINISAQQKENEWGFSISDNGIGINSEYFEMIFQIFQRLHNNIEYNGTGIGLANCKKIVELYGGRIWVESEEGKGSTFFFTLPI